MRNNNMFKNTKGRMTALLYVIAIVLLLWGCGGGVSSYDAVSTEPVLTQTATPSIVPATLKSWMDSGLVLGVSAPYVSGEKVVILDYTDKISYQVGHIPGAVWVDGSELLLTRLEGVGDMASLVTDGAHMDAIIQRAGIDENTSIVCTGSGLSSATRLYATLRYWGFPKSRIKLLEGVTSGWKTANPTLMSTDAPTITPSTYCVTPNGVNRVQADLRASLGEMMDVVKNFDGTKHAIIDDLTNQVAANIYDPLTVKSTDPLKKNMYLGYPGSTSGLLPYAVSTTTEYVVFEGHMKNAVNLYAGNLYASNVFKSAADLKTLFNGVGMDETKTAYVYCRAGNFATLAFYALDAILGWNVVWYDGSWGQWALMADKNGGKLKAGSIWCTYPLSVSSVAVTNTDDGNPKYARDAVDGVTYNILNNTTPTGTTKFTIQPLPYYSALDTFTTVTDPNASQVEKADKAYKSPISSSSGGSTGGSSGGGC